MNIVGPRNRAPLGMKTTNAKAIAFQTPGGLKGDQSIKTQKQNRSPRHNRAKVKIHTSPEHRLEDESDDDIEPCAGRGVPLEDHPDDWTPKDYSCLAPENFTKGWTSVSLFGTDISDRKIRAMEEHQANEEKLFAERDAAILRNLENWDDDLPKTTQSSKKTVAAKANTKAPLRDKKTTTKVKESNPGTNTSRAFATALATMQPPASRQPGPTASTQRAHGFAAPTKSMLARNGKNADKENDDRDIQRVKAFKAKSASAKTASNTTLGYGKGRSVSGHLRRDTPTNKNTRIEPQEQTSPSKDGLEQMYADIFQLDLEDDSRPLSPFEFEDKIGVEDEDFQLGLPPSLKD